MRLGIWATCFFWRSISPTWSPFETPDFAFDFTHDHGRESRLARQISILAWSYCTQLGLLSGGWRLSGICRFHSETRTHLSKVFRLLIWKVSPKQPQRRGGYPSARSQNATFRQPLAALTDNLADLLRASCRLILNNPTWPELKNKSWSLEIGVERRQALVSGTSCIFSPGKQHQTVGFQPWQAYHFALQNILGARANRRSSFPCGSRIGVHRPAYERRPLSRKLAGLKLLAALHRSNSVGTTVSTLIPNRTMQIVPATRAAR